MRDVQICAAPRRSTGVSSVSNSSAFAAGGPGGASSSSAGRSLRFLRGSDVPEDAILRFFTESSTSNNAAATDEDEDEASPLRFPDISPLPPIPTDEEFLKKMVGVLIVWMLATGAGRD